MFTGIIKEVGSVLSFQPRGGTADIEIGAPETLLDAEPGDSICVNGICLTAARIAGNAFLANVSGETLRRTTLQHLRPGEEVNIEPSLTPASRMGGHIVAGHVDGVGEIVRIGEREDYADIAVRFPEPLAPYIAEKGSIAIDGISLTVTGVSNGEFGVAVVPFTLRHTNLRAKSPGSKVNLEADVVARYVERLMKYNNQLPAGGLTPEKLREYGYGTGQGSNPW